MVSRTDRGLPGGGDPRWFGAAPRHQLRHAARQSSFAPFFEDRDQSRIFSASRSMAYSASPAPLASCLHSTGSIQSLGRREAFF